VGNQVRLVYLALAGEEGGQHGDTDAAAKISNEVADARNLVALVARHTHVAKNADRNEDEGEARHLIHAPEDQGAEVNVQIQVRDVVETGGDHGEAKAIIQRGSILVESRPAMGKSIISMNPAGDRTSPAFSAV